MNTNKENPNLNTCLDVEIVKDCNFTDEANLNNEVKSNLNNLNNLNNLTNINNLNNTSILGIPDNKTEFVYYFLYDNPEKTGEEIVKAAELSSIDSFNTLKNRNNKNRNKENIIVSKKDGTTNLYDISQELREQIQLRINQKIESKKRELENINKNIQEEKSQEELSNSIKDIFSNTKYNLIEICDNFIWLDLKELQELEPELFENFQYEPLPTIELMRIILEDMGYSQTLRFRNFTECFKSSSIDSVRSNDIEKILLIECRSSILSDVRPQVTEIKYECPKCGTIISVNQIEKRIVEPSRCTCGRCGGFKELNRNLIDRAKVELEDLADLTETPSIKSISGFATEHLTNSIELSKLNPGNELKILCILRTAEKYITGGKSTSLEMYVDILEVEPFESIIDVSSFTDNEIEEFKKISNIIQTKNSLEEIRGSFSSDVIGNEEAKDTLILKAVQSRGKDKSNILLISNPGTAKSVMAKKYHKLVPGTSYVSGAGSSAVGLSASAEKKDDGWVLKPGVVVTTREDVVIDEFNSLHDEEKPKLQEAMSERMITINKASIHAKLKAECGIIALANPIRGVFNLEQDLTKQFNIPKPILNRFDLIFVIKDDFDFEKDKKIATQMLLRESNKIHQKYSDDVLKKFFLYTKSQQEPTFDDELINYAADKYAAIRHGVKFKEDNHKINPRLFEAIIRLPKALAKIKMQTKVSKEDIDFIINLLQKTYLDFDLKEEADNQASDENYLLKSIKNLAKQSVWIKKSDLEQLSIENLNEKLTKLKTTGLICEPKTDFFQLLM